MWNVITLEIHAADSRAFLQLTDSTVCPLLYIKFTLAVLLTPLNLLPPEQRWVSPPSNMLSIINLVNMEAVSHPLWFIAQFSRARCICTISSPAAELKGQTHTPAHLLRIHVQQVSVAPADGQMTAQQLWPRRRGARRRFRLPLRQNFGRGGTKWGIFGKEQNGPIISHWGRFCCQKWLFSSVTRENFVVFSHGTARAIYMQSSSKSISSGPKTHAAAVSHEWSLTRVLTFSLRNYRPYRLTSCSAQEGGAPRYASQRLMMESKAAARGDTSVSPSDF